MKPIETVFDNQKNVWTAFIEAKETGNFQFQLVVDNVKSKVGYILVEPDLVANGNSIPLKAICCQTILTRNMGPFERWEQIFENVRALNYNMIHLTPLHTLGVSGSCYSLYDQRVLTHQLEIEGKDNSEQSKEARLQEFIKRYEDKELFTICDVVWNHTAINTPWINEHPEACFTLDNSPHLRAAYCLDRVFQKFNERLEKRMEIVNTAEDVEKIMGEISRRVIPSIRLWEFYVLDVSKQITLFKKVLQNPESIRTMEPSTSEPHDHHPFASGLTDECVELGDGRRGAKTVKMSCAYKLFGQSNQYKNVAEKCLAFKRAIDAYNIKYYEQVNADIKDILKNTQNHIMGERVHPDGPRYPFIDEKTPLLPRYFTTIVSHPYRYDQQPELDEDDEFVERPIDGANNFAVANAGWVLDQDPTVELTSPKYRIYLRRSLVSWADSIRLRYGAKQEDSPFLWEMMKNYTVQLARVCHGFRLDNCHSTPLHLASYLLNAAREVRPNLYVTAELFSDVKAVKTDYIEQLGITSLIEEAIQCGDPKHLGGRIYKCSGGIKNAVGVIHPTTGGYFGDERVWLTGEHPRHLLFDCTHDNQPPAVQRTANDALPNTALTAMANCSTGSVLGYDQLVPVKIDVVTDARLYPFETVGGGIEVCKSALNTLHQQLVLKGYNEFHIHQEGDYFIFMRHQPENHKSVFMVAHTAFTRKQTGLESHPALKYSGDFVEELFCGNLRTDRSTYEANKEFINGLIPTLYWPHNTPTPHPTKTIYHLSNSYVRLEKFPPGSVLCFLTALAPEATKALEELKGPHSVLSLKHAINSLSLIDINRILYRCPEEDGMGAYVIEGQSSSYCGIAGLIPILRTITSENSVTHPFVNHLRQGNWLMNFHLDRLNNFHPTYCTWYKQNIQHIKHLPNFLIPKYFYWFVIRLYNALLQRAYSLMSKFVNESDWFIKALSLCSVQLMGDIQSAPLDHVQQAANKPSPSLSAGLRFFSSGFMRNWGRDTFISLRGLMLVTGRFDDALHLIKGFATTYRHGLIPNLLDGGHNPRYNARDASWWYLQAVQDYCEFVYGDDHQQVIEFLNNTKIIKKFSTDDPNTSKSGEEVSLGDIIHGILQSHAQGISFREWNAGERIDAHMSDEGFNVRIRMDRSTGLIYGGNRANCGTWMDKMGEAGHQGVPATPRDGANVEIIGLLTSTVRWLALLHTKGYARQGVTLIGDNEQEELFTFADWHKTLVQNFEKRFWIPTSPQEDSQYTVTANLVNRRGIYKDTEGSLEPYCDYQLRPNQCVAMVVAPELFQREHANSALQIISNNLLGPLGMKTLDPSDWNYSPNYNVQETAAGPTEKGFNYHQGPEWVWLYGYYIRALINFHSGDTKALKNDVNRLLTPHKLHIEKSDWAGLPELTNLNGAYCSGSCDTQAWSSATILDALHSLSKLN